MPVNRDCRLPCQLDGPRIILGRRHEIDDMVTGDYSLSQHACPISPTKIRRRYRFFLFLLTTLFLAPVTRADHQLAVELDLLPEQEAFARSALLPLARPHEIAGTSRENALIKLGYRLFRDRSLSGDGRYACIDCHDFRYGGSNGQARGRPDGILNVPSIFNLAGRTAYYRNGRAHNLAEQVRMAIANPEEMRSDWPSVIDHLRQDQDYRAGFRNVFDEDVDQSQVSQAIAAYIETLVTLDAPFDRYLHGDTSALDHSQRKGYEIFLSAGCQACHQGRQIGANVYQKLGIVNRYEDHPAAATDVSARPVQDRYQVTSREEDRQRFLVPSLRNVTLTGPYLHDGSVTDLRDVVRLMFQYQLGREVAAGELSAILDFLAALEGRQPEALQ